MPPAISRKGDRFQSYRSGYHEVAPSLDGLCGKHISLSGIKPAICSMSSSMKLVSNSNHIIISVHTSQNQTLSIMNTPAQARQRGSRSHETGCEALIQAHGERHPQSAKRSTIHTPNHNSLNNEQPHSTEQALRFLGF